MLYDNVTYVAGLYEFIAARNCAKRTAPARFTLVLVKRNHDWLIAHRHSLLPRHASPVTEWQVDFVR